MSLPRRYREPAWLIAVLALGAVTRSRNLNLPPVDYHSHRQTETAQIAQNYSEEGYRLFFPTVNGRGHTPGYVESELSLYAYTVALGYGLFGFHEAIARLLSIAATVATGYLLFLIARRIWGTRAGLLTVIFFAFLSPFGLYFGRAIMGDMLVLLWVTLAVYAGQRWAQDKASDWWFGLAAISAAFAGLSKLPALYVGVPLAVLVIQKDGLPGVLLRPRNWVAGLGVPAVVAAWYLHAAALGRQTGLSVGILGSSDKIADLGLLLNPGLYLALYHNISWRLLTLPGVVLWLLGMTLPPKRLRSELPLYLWVAGVLAYLLAAAKGVLGQDYYTLAVLPPAALFVGKALDAIYKCAMEWAEARSNVLRLGSLALTLAWIAVLPWSARLATQSAGEMFQPLEAVQGAWEGGQWVQAATPPDAGLVVVGTAPPEGHYFSHRKGIYLSADDLTPERLEVLQKDGWPYFVYFNPYWSSADPDLLLTLHERLAIVGGGHWFLAYRLDKPPASQPEHPFQAMPQWGEQMTLLGYNLTPARLVNSKMYLLLYWHLDRTLEDRLVGFVHVWDHDGKLCGQEDHQLLNGLVHPDRWTPGQVVPDPFEIDLSKCPGQSQYKLDAGMYLAANGERVPLTSQAGPDQLYWFSVNLPITP